MSLLRSLCGYDVCRFNDGYTQQALYDRVGAPLVHSCLLGYDTTLFVYGQTGKTATPLVPDSWAA